MAADASAVAVGADGNVYVAGRVLGVRGTDLYTVAYDGGGALLWARLKDGGSDSGDRPYAIAVDAQGYVIVTGEAARVGGRDILTVAYDAEGTELWAQRRSVEGSTINIGYALACDDAGRVYVAAYRFVGGGSGFLTLAYDVGSGAELWSATATPDALGSASPAAIAVDGAGRVFVTGWGQADATADVFTVAYDAAGQELWQALHDGPGQGYDAATALVIDSAGRVVVAGETANGSNADFLVVAYDAGGNELWARARNGIGNGDDRAAAIAADGAGRIFVTGGSFNGGDDDALTVAYDGAGQELWAGVRDGTWGGDDQASDLAVTSGGSVVAAGRASAGTSHDYLTVVYAPADGTELWARFRDASPGSDDVAAAVAADAAGRVFVTGGAHGERDWDFLSLAYDAAGTELWVAEEPPAPSSATPDDVRPIAVDANGTAYVTGVVSGRLLTVAYDADGNELWTAIRDDGPFLGYVSAGVAVGAGGVAYVAGAVRNGTDYDFLFIAYGSAGEELWSLTLGTGPGRDDVPVAMGIDAAGRIFAAGYTTDHVADDYLTVAVSDSGSLLWSRVRDGGYSYESAIAVEPDGSGGVVVGGNSWDLEARILTVAYDQAGNEHWSASRAGSLSAMTRTMQGDLILAGGWDNGDSWDFLTVSYAATGQELWARTEDTPGGGHDVARAVAADAGGAVYVTGNGGGTGFLTVAYDAVGTRLWRTSRSGGGAGRRSIAVDGDGTIFAVGSWLTGTNFDYFLLAYDAEGRQKFSYRYDGGPEDRPYGIVGLAGGGAILTGFSKSELRDLLTVRLLPQVPVFLDGFESGDTSAWSQTQP